MEGNIEREYGALGGLFQQIIQDMKVGDRKYQMLSCYAVLHNNCALLECNWHFICCETVSNDVCRPFHTNLFILYYFYYLLSTLTETDNFLQPITMKSIKLGS